MLLSLLVVLAPGFGLDAKEKREKIARKLSTKKGARRKMNQHFSQRPTN